MSKWKTLRLDREYLGELSPTGYYVALSGKNYVGWYVIVPLKLIHLDESNDFFDLVTHEGFEYRGLRLIRDETNTIQVEEKKTIMGSDVIDFFKGRTVNE